MNNEHAGERVFENVDEALAERIVSRAKENSREPESGSGRAYNAGIDRNGKPRPVSIMKIAIPVVLILIGIWVLIRRGGR
jgi:hypothetical protein